MWERPKNINLSCSIFEPSPFYLSKNVLDEWTAWHKLWWDLGATENQIQYLILLDVEMRIREEAAEMKIWSPSYARSLQTVWIGSTDQQSMGQMQIHYSKQITKILNSTHRASRTLPWTRARLWTIQGHDAFESHRNLPKITSNWRLKRLRW